MTRNKKNWREVLKILRIWTILSKKNQPNQQKFVSLKYNFRSFTSLFLPSFFTDLIYSPPPGRFRPNYFPLRFFFKSTLKINLWCKLSVHYFGLTITILSLVNFVNTPFESLKLTLWRANLVCFISFTAIIYTTIYQRIDWCSMVDFAWLLDGNCYLL